MSRTVIYWIFAACIAMGALLIAIALADSVPNAAGQAHPEINGLQVGGDGAARLQHIGWMAFLFQCLLLLMVVCLCTLGVSERYRSKGFFACMGGSLLFMLFAWWQMYSGHQEFLQSGESNYFMGFPVATAWQVYGTWLGAIPLIAIYALGFRKYIYTEADEAEFKAILQQSKSALSKDEAA